MEQDPRDPADLDLRLEIVTGLTVLHQQVDAAYADSSAKSVLLSRLIGAASLVKALDRKE